MKRLKKILRNERGQGMLEYVLILAMILVIAALFKDKIKTAILSLTDQTSSKIGTFDPNQGG